MPLGIGNNLIRNGGGLNPDGLALDLQFAADKTLTARKGPTPVLTRGSGATQVGSTGLIEYAPENLSISLTSYTKVNFQTPTSISDGITADSLRYTPTGTPSAYMYMSVTFTEAVRVTISTYVRSSTLTTFNYRDFAAIAKNSRNFNPSTGQWAVSGGDTQFTGYTVESLSNGWYRISCNYTPTDATGSRYFGIMAGQDSATSVDLGGMQIERHPTARAYNPTTTAAFYGPRFDHDPVTLASRGLLIEESRTNLFTQSEAWQTGASFTGPTTPTITSDTTTSPDGQLTADTLSGSTGTAVDGSVNSTWRQPNISSATAYTFSIYVRSLGVATKAEIRIRDNSAGTSVQTLDTSLTSSWKRISVTATTGPTTSSIRCIIQNTDGPIAIWGAQLEAGTSATSYIPTTTSTVIRSADVCTIANTSSFWSSSEFTLFTNANWAAAGFDSYGSNFNITNGFFGARRTIGNSVQGIIRSSGVNADINFGSFTTGSMRMALAHSTGQQAGSLNGATAIQQNSAFVPSSNPPFNIGYSGTGAYINGHIAAIRYYKKRLPNAKLQAITA